MEDSKRADVEFVSLQKQSEDLVVLSFHMDGDLGRLLERILKAQH